MNEKNLFISVTHFNTSASIKSQSALTFLWLKEFHTLSEVL